MPIHYQIRDQIVDLIQTGQLAAGQQLPTMQALSAALGVNFNTVAHAYRELAAEGVIAIRRGEGSFVLSAPGPDELARARQETLRTLVSALFSDGERLGFTRAEVEQAVRLHLSQHSR